MKKIIISTIAICFVFCISWMAQIAIAADKYEPDESRAQANILMLNDQVPAHQNIPGYEWRQFHDFDHQGDQDWVIFYAHDRDTPYTISVTDAGKSCDAVIEIYDAIGTLVKKTDDRVEEQDERAEWICTQKGYYYAKISQYDPNKYGADTGYTLMLYQPIGTFGAFIKGKVNPVVSKALMTTDGKGEAITLPNGNFFMPHQAGSFTLTASAAGYSPVSMPIAPSEISTLDVTVELAGTTTPTTYALTISKSGSGAVTSSPSGISCGSDCSESYASDTSVTLTATPDSGYTFSGWSGDSDCSDGVVTMNAARNCEAVFVANNPMPQSLTVNAYFDKSSYTTKDKLLFTVDVVGNISSDLYVAIFVPAGNAYDYYTMTELNTLAGRNEIVPYRLNLAPAEQFSKLFMDVFLSGVFAGSYAGCGVAVTPGAEPLDTGKWIDYDCQWITISN